MELSGIKLRDMKYVGVLDSTKTVYQVPEVFPRTDSIIEIVHKAKYETPDLYYYWRNTYYNLYHEYLSRMIKGQLKTPMRRYMRDACLRYCRKYLKVGLKNLSLLWWESASWYEDLSTKQQEDLERLWAFHTLAGAI